MGVPPLKLREGARERTVILAIMDGVGIGLGDTGDAVAKARTPFLDRLREHPSYRSLKAHGVAVGMPSDGDMGNSEVGHNVLGSGRVVAQGATLVNDAIATSRIFDTREWGDAVAQASSEGKRLHFIGLFSDGNVHSHIDHLYAMVRRAARDGVKKIRLHLLLDGRDVPKRSAHTYLAGLAALTDELKKSGADLRVASGGGRMTTTMDRYEADWSMVERGWKVHVEGDGRKFGSLEDAIETLREEAPGIGDQELPEFVIEGSDGEIRDGDAAVAFNFRGDRMLELCRAFEDSEVPFERSRHPAVHFVGMTLYDGDTHTPARYLVAPPEIEGPLSERLAAAGVRQFACSETQKFGHVTYFWNGNRSGRFDESSETYVEIPSASGDFDSDPAMSAEDITDAVVDALEGGEHRFLRLNYANGDMVGHTGNLDATRKAVECVDACLGRLWNEANKRGAVLVVTADHGNADDMYERDKAGAPKSEAGEILPRTSHSLNPVPFAVLGADDFVATVLDGEPGLSGVASTLSLLLGFEAPDDLDPPLLAPS